MPVISPSTSSSPNPFARAKKYGRYLAYGAVFTGVVLLAVGGWGVKALRHGLPEYKEAVVLRGMESEARVVRDEHGVPHIFAATMDDAARALGYVHAGERLFQMEMQRRAGQGRLSEVAGSDTLGIDKFTRTLGLYYLAESGFNAMSPEAQRYFQAYADGVNAWLEKHHDNLPPEFTIMGFTPEPWKPADSVVWGKLMALQLSHNYKLELLRAALAKHISPSMMKALFLEPIAADPVTIAPHSRMPVKDGAGKNMPANPSLPPLQKSGELSPAHSGAADTQLTLGSFLGLDHAASNEWVISGGRTDSGKPILANDPHLGLEAPILWYLVRIVTPQLWIKGATVPGLPVVLLGQNDHIAWGFTTTNSDTQDLFIETIDPKNPENYLTPDGSAPFVVREEKIRVKHGIDRTLNVRVTRHGPVLSDIDDDMAEAAGKGKVVALAFTSLNADDRTSEALVNLNHAYDWKSFLDALALYQAPTQNIVYADTAGHIGFINPGLVPVRMKGDGTIPVDGASGAYDWRGMVPFSSVPRVYDPKAGFVFNANSTVINGAFSPYNFSHDWDEPYRSRRLQNLFDTIVTHTLDTSAAMQMDDVSTVVPELLPYLIRAAPAGESAKQALTLLKAWDGRMDASRPEPLIFESWLYQMHKKILADKAETKLLAEKGPYSAGTLAIILNADDKEWCGKEGCAPVVRRALDDALDNLQHRYGRDMTAWRWGDEHVTVLKNKVFGHVPFLAASSDLSVSSNGGYYTLNRGESAEVDTDHPFLRRHAGGFRGVYDLGDPNKSRFMIATGESGHILSAHYGDLVHLWNDGKYITLSGTHDELAGRGLPELVISPAPQ